MEDIGMFKNSKRILSLALAVAMLAGVVAVVASCDLFGGNNGGNEPEKKAEYTYNTYLSTFPTVWNNHTYQTATDGEIIGYTEPGFYAFDYNENKDGYKLVPDMATQEPIDVTADYVGDDWGIAEGDTAKAWKIVLRNDIKWQDGTAITAHDFVTSMQLLLNPEANNYRADTMYTGNMVIYNSKNYFYGGKDVDEDNGATGAFVVEDLVKGADGVYTQANGKAVYITVTGALDWLGGRTLEYYVNGYTAEDGTCAMFDLEAFKALKALANADTGYITVTDESLELLEKVITYSPSWGETEAEVVNYMMYTSTYPELDFDKVGIRALSDTELVLILERPLEGFYLLYSLTGAWLVNEELYNSCVEIKDGVYYNTYGTSAETYMAYGPYMLESFQKDKQFVLVKNPYYYGYNDTTDVTTWQTTKIVYDYVEKPETAMELFLQGKLDSKGLDVDQIKDYSMSDHVYYTDGASTFFIALNPDMDALVAEQAKTPGTNKTILTVKEFRQALSFSLDRAAFNLACDPTGSSAFAVFNNLIISDPENGTSYRTTEEAKKVLVDFWGLTDQIGEGKLYADMDEAIDSITGYNLEMGKQLFNAAYDKAIEDGLMSETDVVEIKIGTPNATTKFYTNGYEFLVNNYTEAVKGTKLEGKLRFTKDDTLGNGFADALRANTVDMLFGVGWQGAALDPYYLMTAYTQDSYQYDPAWDTSAEEIEMTIDGVKYTATVWDWTLAMQGKTIEIVPVDGGDAVEFSCGLNDEKPELRLQLLAALEGAVLSTYDLIPINNESSAALKGMQIKYYTEEYIYGVGRGGIKYMTYNYTDAEWDAFVAKQGGTLNYK